MPTRPEMGALLNLEVDLIPASNPGRTNRAMVPRYITVHNTSNTSRTADADAHRRLLNRSQGYYYTTRTGRKIYLTWHYTVDDRQTIKHLNVSQQGIHASSSVGNSSSIGIEICINAGIDQDAAFLRAARLVAVLRHDLAIGAANVRAHYHWNRKKCPILLMDSGRPGTKWNAFLTMCDRELASIV